MRHQEQLCEETALDVAGLHQEVLWLQTQVLATEAKLAAMTKQVRYRDKMLTHTRELLHMQYKVENALRAEIKRKK